MSNENENGQAVIAEMKSRVSKTAKWLWEVPLRVTCDKMSDVEERLFKERVYFALGLVHAKDEQENGMTDCISEEEITDAE